MSLFQFKQFALTQFRSAHKVGTDAMILGALIDCKNPQKGLDIGAGTGVLSLMVAQKYPEILVDAIEIDNDSCLDCEENFSNSPWNNRLTLKNEDALHWNSDKTYDLIFSNPPYYQNSLLSLDSRIAQAKHEEYFPLQLLMNKAAELLSDSGDFWLIGPAGNEQNTEKTAQKENLFLNKLIRIDGVRGRHKLTVYVFGKKASIKHIDHKVIRENDGSYALDYIQLTKDFHGRDLTTN